jgi:transposase
MEYVAIDLHLRRTQISDRLRNGTAVKEGKFDTSRAELTRVFGNRPRLRVLLESSTDSEWVAQHLEAIGHDVIVADPTYALMYGSRSRKVKTDGRDTAALADACRLGIYRRAHGSRQASARGTSSPWLRKPRHIPWRDS